MYAFITKHVRLKIKKTYRKRSQLIYIQFQRVINQLKNFK